MPASSELLDFFLRQIELVQLREDLLTEVLAEALPRVTTVANLLRKIFHLIFKQSYEVALHRFKKLKLTLKTFSFIKIVEMGWRTQKLFQILKSWQLTYAIVIHLLPDDVAFDLSVGLLLDLETNLTKIKSLLGCDIIKKCKKESRYTKCNWLHWFPQI